jgi:hypothetical protein
VLSVSSTRKLTLVSSSRKSLSRTWREVTYLPSCPANGLSFTMKAIFMVGSSTRMRGNASGLSGEASVSPTLAVAKPDMATI